MSLPPLPKLALEVLTERYMNQVFNDSLMENGINFLKTLDLVSQTDALMVFEDIWG